MRSGTADPGATAAALDAAHLERRTIDVESVDVGDLASAYAVQRALTSRRLDRGDAVVGWKLGYTTAAMREQMGIDAPNYGPLLASMRIEGVLPGRLTQPRVEPEIALVVATGPRPGASPDEVLRCCSAAHLALEVVDSVWTAYRFDLEHNTADGSSAAGVVLGDELPLAGGTVTVALHVESLLPDGSRTRAEEQGVSRLIDAARSTAWLVDRLAEEGLALRPGDLVLTGGLTPALPVPPGAVVQAVAEVDGVRAEVRASGSSV